MKTCLIILLVAVAAFSQTAVPTEPPPVSTVGVSALVSRDRLQIRDIQLSMAQAHIARLQADAGVREAEIKLAQLVQSLKVQYGCLDCQLNSDFTWTPPAKVEVPKTDVVPAPQADPAPPKASGQTSKKE